MKKITLLALGLMIFYGCSSFQLSGAKKEVIVDMTSPNTFTVTFCGNAYMSQKDVEKYALQRASSEALARGCSYFIVVNKEDKSKICALNSRTDTNRLSAVPDSLNTENLATSDFEEPNIILSIQCPRVGEKVPENAINAEKFLHDNFPGLRK